MQYESFPFRVTFTVRSELLGKTFENVEFHRSEADYKLRACALNWQIKSVERVNASRFQCA